MRKNPFYSTPTAIAILALTVLLFSSLVAPASADTPVILEIKTSTEGDDTVFNIEVRHNNPTSSHYVNIIEVEVDGDAQRVNNLEPQTSTQFTYKHVLGKSEYQSVRVRVNCNIHGWSSWATIGEQPQSGCLIATATYESELSPQVQFLRGFRDKTVLNTFAGSNFMTAFNGFYYSFSPSVASVISDNDFLRDTMKVILYPLIGVLHLSSAVFTLFSFSPEFGVMMAGLVASSFIGIIYFLPFALLLSYIKSFRVSARIIRLTTQAWTYSVLAIFVAAVAKSSTIMMMSSSMFILATITITTLTAMKVLSKRLTQSIASL
jgi:desulfoferrodoxin (superoxide reductase-like protein)